MFPPVNLVNAASAFVIFVGGAKSDKLGMLGLGISGNEPFSLSTAASCSVDPISPVAGLTNLVLPAIVSGLYLLGLQLSPRPSLTNFGVSTVGSFGVSTFILLSTSNLDTTSVPVGVLT